MCCINISYYHQTLPSSQVSGNIASFKNIFRRFALQFVLPHIRLLNLHKLERSLDGQDQNQMNIFFVAGDGEAIYRKQKLDQELNVAQIMISTLQNSDLN